MVHAMVRASEALNRVPALSRCSLYALRRAGYMMIDGVISLEMEVQMKVRPLVLF